MRTNTCSMSCVPETQNHAMNDKKTTSVCYLLQIWRERISNYLVSYIENGLSSQLRHENIFPMFMHLTLLLGKDLFYPKILHFFIQNFLTWEKYYCNKLCTLLYMKIYLTTIKNSVENIYTQFCEMLYGIKNVQKRV